MKEKSKMGRPTDDPKSIVKRARMSEDDAQKLKVCSEALGVSESDVIRLGINEIYEKQVQNPAKM